MKKQLLLTRVLLLAVLLMGAGSAWADETILNESFENGTPTDWTAISTGKDGKTTGYSAVQSLNDAKTGSYVWKLGSNNNPYGALTTSELTIGGEATLTFYAYSKKDLQPKLLVSATNCTLSGDVTAETAKAAEWTQFTVNITDVTDKVTITFTHDENAKSYIYIDDVVIVKKAEVIADGAETSVAINEAGITNLDVYKGAAAGQLTATVSSEGSAVNGATVEWKSSDESVATIDDNGNVTLVKAGTVSFTASYAGVSGTYKSSSATSSEFTVTDSTPATVYELLTSNAVLSEGDQLLLAYSTTVLGEDKSGYFAGVTGATITDNTISVKGSEGYNLLTLGKAGDNWTLYTSLEKKYLSYTGSGNNLNSSDDASATTAQWTISIDNDNNATITNASATSRAIKWNSSIYVRAECRPALPCAGQPH